MKQFAVRLHEFSERSRDGCHFSRQRTYNCNPSILCEMRRGSCFARPLKFGLGNCKLRLGAFEVLPWCYALLVKRLLTVKSLSRQGGLCLRNLSVCSHGCGFAALHDCKRFALANESPSCFAICTIVPAACAVTTPAPFGAAVTVAGASTSSLKSPA